MKLKKLSSSWTLHVAVLLFANMYLVLYVYKRVLSFKLMIKVSFLRLFNIKLIYFLAQIDVPFLFLFL